MIYFVFGRTLKDNLISLERNKQHQPEYTVYYSEREQLTPFLDVNQNNKLEFEIFRKPNATDSTMPEKSNEFKQIKYSALHSLTHQLINRITQPIKTF